jgi:hypothetical protein
LNVLGADAIEIVFAGIDPSVRYIKPIGENGLVDDNFIRAAAMLDRVDCTFSSSMHDRYADIDCVHAGSRAEREAPLAGASWPSEARFGPAQIVVLRLAGGDINVIPALIGRLGKAQSGII